MRILYRAALLILLMASCGARFAFASTDRVSIGNDIIVTEGDTASDVVCIACSVTLRGNVAGDIVALLGSVKTEGPRWISGDVVTIGGDVSLQDSSSVQGSMVIVGGDLNLASEATVRGDREVFPGREWLLLPLAPFIILFGVVWLAIWFVRRNRYRFPMYPQGRF